MYFRHLFKSNKVLKTHRFIQISQVGEWDKVPQKLNYKIGPWKHKKKLCSLKNYVNPPSLQRLVSSVPSCQVGGDGDHLTIDWGGGEVTTVSSIWLRDNSPASYDQVAMARTLLMSDLDVGVKIEKVRKVVGRKLKINAEKIFRENISYKLSCHVAIRARASCNKYRENFVTADFSLLWQISRSEEPQSGVRLHLSDGHTTQLTFPWLADRLRNTKWKHSDFGWVKIFEKQKQFYYFIFCANVKMERTFAPVVWWWYDSASENIKLPWSC